MRAMCAFVSSYKMSHFKKRSFPVHLRLDHAAIRQPATRIARGSGVRHTLPCSLVNGLFSETVMQYYGHCMYVRNGYSVEQSNKLLRGHPRTLVTSYSTFSLLLGVSQSALDRVPWDFEP